MLGRHPSPSSSRKISCLRCALRNLAPYIFQSRAIYSCHFLSFDPVTLVQKGIPAYSLDGDNVRTGLNRNLGFSKEDREENVRRVAEVAKLFADAGIVVLCSFVSPFAADRRMAREIHEEADLPFFEVFVQASLRVCEARDVKGLYKKARQGIIRGFTGIDQAYDVPSSPDLVVNTENATVRRSADIVLDFLQRKQIIPESCGVKQTVQELFVNEDRLEDVRKEMRTLSAVEIGEMDVQWLQVLAEGWATPLKGFMREDEYLQVSYLSNINYIISQIEHKSKMCKNKKWKSK